MERDADSSEADVVDHDILAAPFHYILAVWGDAYTDVFLRYGLPTQLSKNNFPAVANGRSSIYNIFTFKDDLPRLEAAPAIAELRRWVDVRFHIADIPRAEALSRWGRHEILSEFHRAGIRDAGRRGGYLMFLGPDALMSDGTLTAVERRVARGAEVIFIAGVRACLEDVLPTLDVHREGMALPLSAETLARHLVERPHPLTARLFLDAPDYGHDCASHLYYRVDDEGMTAHCWHMHPLVVKAAGEGASFEQTIDGDFVRDAMRTPETVHVVTDSTELCMIEISRRDQFPPDPDRVGPFDENAVIKWGREKLLPVHSRLFRTPVRFRIKAHSNDAAFDAAERRVSPLIARLVDEIEPIITAYPRLHDVGDLPARGRVFLYGAGACGRRLLSVFRAAGIDVAGFVDSRISSTLDGLPVRAVAEVSAFLRDDDVIVIASQYRADIAGTLHRLGMRRVFDGYPLFERVGNPAVNASPRLTIRSVT